MSSHDDIKILFHNLYERTIAQNQNKEKKGEIVGISRNIDFYGFLCVGIDWNKKK